MEVVWNENELVFQELGNMVANLGFRQLLNSNLYIIERVWVKEDQNLKLNLIQTFVQRLSNDHSQVIPLCPEALEFFNHHPEFHSYLAKPLHHPV